MPYVSPAEALNRMAVAIPALRRKTGPPPWRVPIVATADLRVVLIAWEPGFRTVPHVHPRADEVFHVLRGRALFRIGSAEPRVVGPGTILLAPHGTWHDIAVTGEEPLLLLAALAPNEEATDETIEGTG